MRPCKDSRVPTQLIEEEVLHGIQVEDCSLGARWKEEGKKDGGQGDASDSTGYKIINRAPQIVH